jgi:hypothetical protein
VLGPYALTTSNSVSASSYSYYTAYTQSVPLPVTLLRFEGERRGKAVQLRWTTTAEVNAAGFEIQRSANLQGFEKIGYVAAVEQPGPVNAYAFVDEDQAQGSYYRLKQLDRNEQHVYSKPVFVAAESFLGSALALYPNPSTGQVYLSLPDASEAEMHLLSANGFRLATFVATPLEVDARLNACLQSLSAGLYVLEIHQAGRVYFNKIIRR